MTARPHVVVLPGNDVVSDPRVLKYVATLASFGLQVTALGVTRVGERQEGSIGTARLVVEAVPLTLGSGARQRLGQLAVVFRAGYRTADQQQAARAQVNRWARRARASAGLRRIVLRSALLLPRAWVRLASVPLRLAPRGDAEELAARRRAEQLLRYREQRDSCRWRQVLPTLLDDDRVIGGLLDRMTPDVVHVHDVFMLGVATGAVRRARAAGRDVRLIYDAHEYIPGLAYLPARTVGAYCDLEREFIGEADRIVTVSEPLADLLVADHDLHRQPTVVLNAPTVAEPPAGFESLRERLGLEPAVPLLVYGGGVNTARGVQTAVAGLPQLDGVHLAVVINRHNYVVEQLVQQSARLGVRDRLHLAPYAPPELVWAYLSSVSIGLSTLLHAPNHDVAITNKFCEYLAAGIPIVTSDTPAQAELVREHGLGAVYPAGDVAGFVAAVRGVLDHRAELSRRIREDGPLRHRFSWKAQAAVIRDLYAELLDGLPEEAWQEGSLDIAAVSPSGSLP